MVVGMGAGIVSFAVTQVQRKLSEKNKVLEQAVERSTMTLHQQEQELSRALEIQKDLLPQRAPATARHRIGWDVATRPRRWGRLFRRDSARQSPSRHLRGHVSGKGLTAA